MDDETLVAALESTELAGDQFTHVEHVRVAWWYLQTLPLPDALARCSAAIRRFATAKGAAGKYHETITVAYMLVISERVADMPGVPWDEFAAANPDLFVRSPSVLSRYYTKALLDTDRARLTFVMPDRIETGYA